MVFGGLRVSELLAMKWDDLEPDFISIDEGFCRGDWFWKKCTRT